MSKFLTPDVYTEEVPLLPQSVAEVSTAVPAFIGYTEKATKDGKNVKNTAIRISTLLEYKEVFGGAQLATFNVTYNDNSTITDVVATALQHTMYYALDLYFKNGGGDCYIVSIGNYSENNNSKQPFLDGLEALRREDEPTLIMLGEAVRLSASDYHEVCQAALKQCQDLKDRFCIFDVQKGDVNAEEFRNGIGTNNLKYGAAYTPYLQTSLTYRYKEAGVKISSVSSAEIMQFEIPDVIKITNDVTVDNPKLKINKTGTTLFEVKEGVLTIADIGEGISVSELIQAWEVFSDDKSGFDIISLNDTALVVPITGTKNLTPAVENIETFHLSDIKESKSVLYNKIVSELAKQRIILPPSAAVAGAYATTDRERGVWKAPANVSLNAVIGPVEKITSKDQERLNVDTTAGKSINAIRSFVGKGTMVWGARTLAGNDNEWRYVSVRRLFNMIEESTKKASQFAVFESNDAVTWLKVKAMIESFLYGIWQQGGLAGSTEDQAYFVNIGLGKTMTQQDILEGRMIVEIGLAAVRPAEFIILKFSHKLQEV